MTEEYIADKVVPLVVEQDIYNNIVHKTEEIFGFPMSNAELFEFAMAIGFHMGKRTPLKNRKGIIRRENFVNTSFDALISSLLLYELRKIKQDDSVGDMTKAYQVANEYANTGFHYLNNLVNTETGEKGEFDHEIFFMQMMRDMEQIWKQISAEEEIN